MQSMRIKEKLIQNKGQKCKHNWRNMWYVVYSEIQKEKKEVVQL